MRLSDHAKTRWRERCPELIVEDELATLRAAGKSVIRMLNWMWDDMHERKDKPDPGRRIMVSANGAVMVVVDDLVVTVMRARQIKAWYNERRRMKDWRERAESRATAALPRV